jgi:hypothetical protein
MSAACVHARRAATVWPLTAASAAWRPRQITRKNELQQANMPASKQQFEDAKAFLQKADLQDWLRKQSVDKVLAPTAC